MLIAEDLLLLLTDDSTGRSIVGSRELDHGLAGAVLLEFAMAGRVGVEPQAGVVAGLSLLLAIRAVPKVVGAGRDKKPVQARARQIFEGAWAAAAVRKAVDAVRAATVAAVCAATAAVASSGRSSW